MAIIATENKKYEIASQGYWLEAWKINENGKVRDSIVIVILSLSSLLSSSSLSLLSSSLSLSSTSSLSSSLLLLLPLRGIPWKTPVRHPTEEVPEEAEEEERQEEEERKKGDKIESLRLVLDGTTDL